MSGGGAKLDTPSQAVPNGKTAHTPAPKDVFPIPKSVTPLKYCAQ
jgi:hypothetical protein